LANIPTKIFRGKAKDKNDYYFLSQAFPEKCKNGFIYGQLIIDERQNRYYICASIIATMNCTIANGTVTVIEVIPETIGKDVCLADKNSRKIFEHDVCRVCLGIDTFYIGRIYYDERVAAFGIDYGNEKCNLLSDIIIAKGIDTWIEVIGNIHDNPNLMGAECIK
jgi:uncharacterized phage protein (TIGR01671 family)